MKTPHKHAEVIKAWAEGAEIQFRYPNGTWIGAAAPSFQDPRAEYRVKPEPQILNGFAVKNLMNQWVFVTSFDHCVTTPQRATLTIYPDK